MIRKTIFQSLKILNDILSKGDLKDFEEKSIISIQTEGFNSDRVIVFWKD